MEIKEAELAKFQDDLLEKLEIKKTTATLAKLKEEIEKQPQFLILSKAMTDEALWENIGSSDSGKLPQELENMKLQSESLNPIYAKLLDRIVSTQIDLDTLIPGREDLETESSRIKSGIDELSKQIMEKEIASSNLRQKRGLEFSVLQRNRELEGETLLKNSALGAKTLDAERSNQLTALEKEREVAFQIFQRKREFDVGITKRETANVRTTYNMLAVKWQSAQLARVEQTPDLQLGSRAMAPTVPVGPRTAVTTAVAFVVGLMAATMLVCFLEYLRSAAAFDSSPTSLPSLGVSTYLQSGTPSERTREVSIPRQSRGL